MNKMSKETVSILLKSAGLVVLGVILSKLLTGIGRYTVVNVSSQYHAYVIVFIGWLVLLFPAGELIGKYLSGREPPQYGSSGLEKAGKFIGQLERTIILIFYLAGSLEGIAFLVLAKSIYRFGDLRKGHQNNGREDGQSQREITFSISEYIILGSLFSYTAAIVVGLLVKLTLSHLGWTLPF